MELQLKKRNQEYGVQTKREAIHREKNGLAMESEYQYGNTVRKVEPLRTPEYKPEPKTKEGQKTVASPQTKKNRRRAEVIDFSYAIFLAASVVVIVAACVMYLQLQSSISTRSLNITSLQMQISDLTIENDAALSSIENSIDLGMVKERATELGMVYIDKSQVVEYESPTTNYIKQYEEIPESGILAYSLEIEG